MSGSPFLPMAGMKEPGTGSDPRRTRTVSGVTLSKSTGRLKRTATGSVKTAAAPFPGEEPVTRIRGPVPGSTPARAPGTAPPPPGGGPGRGAGSAARAPVAAMDVNLKSSASPGTAPR